MGKIINVFRSFKYALNLKPTHQEDHRSPDLQERLRQGQWPENPLDFEQNCRAHLGKTQPSLR